MSDICIFVEYFDECDGIIMTKKQWGDHCLLMADTLELEVKPINSKHEGKKVDGRDAQEWTGAAVKHHRGASINDVCTEGWGGGLVEMWIMSGRLRGLTV